LTKQHLSISIDSDVYLSAKNAKVNMSELVTKLLKEYFYNESNIDIEEQQIISQLDDEKNKLVAAQHRIEKLTVILVHKKESSEKKEKERFNTAKTEYEAAKAAGLAEQVFR